MDEATYTEREMQTEVRLMRIEESQKLILAELTALRNDLRNGMGRISKLEQSQTWGRGWMAGAMAVAGGVGALACEIFRRFF